MRYDAVLFPAACWHKRFVALARLHPFHTTVFIKVQRNWPVDGCAADACRDKDESGNWRFFFCPTDRLLPGWVATHTHRVHCHIRCDFDSPLCAVCVNLNRHMSRSLNQNALRLHHSVRSKNTLKKGKFGRGSGKQMFTTC